MAPDHRQDEHSSAHQPKKAAAGSYSRVRARRAARKRSRSALTKLLKKGRRGLVVVDIENLIGGAVINATEVQWARQLLNESLGLQPEDQFIVGICHLGLLEVGINWPQARRVVRSGPSGADRALIEVLREEHIADRFTEVVLVSGDGAFADVVAELAAQGVPTTVVAQRERLSARLRLAACTVVEVPKPPTFEVGQPNFAADPTTVMETQETLAAFDHVRERLAGPHRVIDPITQAAVKSVGKLEGIR